MISQVIRRMYNSRIKVFITHRPYILQKPEDNFEESTILEIQAHDEDIESYIAQQLEMEEKSQCLDKTFKNTITKEIRDQAKGMYNVSFRMILIAGSFWHIFNWSMYYVKLVNRKWKWH